MVTAVDSSILLDILTDDPVRRPDAVASLREARQRGRVLICPIVWSEVRAFFEDAAVMVRALAEADLRFDPFDQECADISGAMWRDYRKGGGQRTRLVADFLIGAHAQVRGGRLLTRDRGFFRRYFRALEVLG